jgi:TonB family protein
MSKQIGVGSKLPVWRFIVVVLGSAVTVAGRAAPAQEAIVKRMGVPAATRPCSEDEAGWWSQLKATADETTAAYFSKDEAIRKRIAERKGRTGSMEELFSPEELAEFAKLDTEIVNLRNRFQALLSEGEDKSYKAPVPDNIHPVLLYTGRPDYTEEARTKKIQGDVRLRVEFRADGTVGLVSITRGLGFGLDEEATEAMRRILFLPAIKEGKFVVQYQTLEASFNLR